MIVTVHLLFPCKSSKVKRLSIQRCSDGKQQFLKFREKSQKICTGENIRISKLLNIYAF